MPYKDPERRKAYNLEYRARPEYKESCARYRENNREEIKHRDRDWKRNKYHTDEKWREEKRARDNEWAKNNRAKKTAALRRVRAEKKQRCLEYLGGVCVGCGTTHNLQFDHIDRSLKEQNIGRMYDYKFERIIPELDKCRLLCSNCHAAKTRAEGDNNKTLKGYKLESIADEGETITIVYRRSDP
jgi:hypothetical protein